MIKQMERSTLLKKHKLGKWTFICSLFITVALLVGVIIFGIRMPDNQIYTMADGSNATSITTDTDGNWYCATTSSKIQCFDENNELISVFDFKDAVSEYDVSLDAGAISNVNASTKTDNIWVTTTSQKVFRLTKTAGEDFQLEIQDHADLLGRFSALTEDENGNVYVISRPGAYFMITKYQTQDLQTPVTSGLIYNITRGANVKLGLVREMKIQYFEARGGNLYVFNRSGFYRFADTLEGMDVGLKLNTTFERKFAALKQEAENALDEDQKNDGIDEQTLKELKAQALQYAVDEHGVVEFDYDSGQVILEAKDLPRSAADVVYMTDKDENAIDSLGIAIDAQSDAVYTLSNTCIYKYDLGDVDTVQQLSIPLAGSPTSVGNAFHYNSVTGKAFITYNNVATVSFVDLKAEQALYTIDLNHNITSIIHNHTGENAYYLYTDTVNFQSGISLLKTVELAAQLEAKTTKVWLTVLAVALVVFVLLTAWSFAYAKSDKFVYWWCGFIKDVRKQWVVYTLIILSLIFLAMFCYYPAAGSIISSFFNYTEENPEKIWNNFQNYKNVFTHPEAMLSFRNMLIYLFFDVLFALLPPLIFAFFLTVMRSKKYSGLTRTLLFIPGIIPGIATTLIWKTGIYGADGVIYTIIKFFTGKEIIVTGQSSTALGALIMMGFPFVGSYLVFYGAMMNVPSSYYEAAELDGITLTKRFIYIDIPLSMAQIKYVFIVTCIGSVQNFGRTDLITDGIYRDTTPIYRMYVLMNKHRDYGGAAAYATILFLFLLAATIVNLRIQTKDKEEY